MIASARRRGRQVFRRRFDILAIVPRRHSSSYRFAAPDALLDRRTFGGSVGDKSVAALPSCGPQSRLCTLFADRRERAPLGAPTAKHQNRSFTSDARRTESKGCRVDSLFESATPARVRGHRLMLATWIETAAKGRLGGPVRAGMWSAAVIGTHPVQDNQRVWLELSADDLTLGRLPAYWIENKGGNSFWHAPIPPQAVGIRLHYRAIVERDNGVSAESTYQDTIVRPNLAGPNRIDRFPAPGSRGSSR